MELEDFNLGSGDLLSSDDFTLPVEEETPAEVVEQNEDIPEETVEVFGDDFMELDENALGLIEETQELGEVDEEDSELVVGEDEKQKGSPSLFGSFAKHLKDNSILSTATDEDLESITDINGLTSIITKEVDSRLTEKQKRIDAALGVGVEPTEIMKYETILGNLDKVTEDALRSETPQGENIRKQIIVQDYINKGFEKERAIREAEKSIKSGTDIEDAILSIADAKKFYSTEYTKLVEEERAADKAYNDGVAKDLETLKTNMLKTESPIAGLKISDNIRENIYTNFSKPVYTDEEGNQYTKLQKYQMDNPIDYAHKIGVLFELTDGFTSIEKLIGQKVNVEKKKVTSQFEKVLANSSYESASAPVLVNGSEGSEVNTFAEQLAQGKIEYPF